MSIPASVVPALPLRRASARGYPVFLTPVRACSSPDDNYTASFNGRTTIHHETEFCNAPLPVVMFQRRPFPGQHSIERVFTDVRAALPPDIDVTTCVLPFESRGILNRLRNLLFAWKRRGTGINHITGDVHYLALVLPPKSTILTVLDLVSVNRLKGFRRYLLELIWYRLPAHRARRITTISESTRQELIGLIPKAASKTLVIHCPTSPRFRPAPPPCRDKPVVLQVGTGANKNLLRVLAASSHLQLHLRIIGHTDSRLDKQLSSTDVEYSQVHDLSEDEMAWEYANADIVIFVSTYEGFGLPIIEAQATGRPVITSSVAPMSEIAGEGALLVNPLDVAAIRRALISLMDDSLLYRLLVQEGFKNVNRFSVESVAASYADIYRSLH